LRTNDGMETLGFQIQSPIYSIALVTRFLLVACTARHWAFSMYKFIIKKLCNSLFLSENI